MQFRIEVVIRVGKRRIRIQITIRLGAVPELDGG